MSAVTNVANVISKKRRKSDSKPQSQISIGTSAPAASNKCLNEKRRRDQENIHFEELAELISASFSDMNSLPVKPDKCAILQETVNQIRKIKEQESEHCDAVQQSDVSSSKPTILASDVFGPLLLEALGGFLLLVNTEGKIQFVSENVISYIKYCRDDLIGESIYKIIHLGDRVHFTSALIPVSIGWSADPNLRSKSRVFNCRLLVKPADRQSDTMDESQQRVLQYENMQMSTMLFPYPGDRSETTEADSEVFLCIARRIPTNEKNSGCIVEQFSTKLDINGKIIAVDTSGVSTSYSQYLNKDLVGHSIIEMCHLTDHQKLTQHLKEALQSGSCTSGIYKLRLTQDKYIHVQTKSTKFPHHPLTRDPEFIMSIHSIIGDNELSGNTESNGSATGSPLPASMISAQNVGGIASTSVTPAPSPVMPTPTSGPAGSVPASSGGVTDVGGCLSSSSSTVCPTTSNVSSANGGNGASSSNSNSGGGGLGGFSLAPELDFSSLDMFPHPPWDVGGSENNLDSASDVGFGVPSSSSPPSSSHMASTVSTVASVHSLSSVSTPVWSNGRPGSRQSAASTPTPVASSVSTVSSGYGSGTAVPLSPVNVISSRASATPPTPFANSFPFSPLPEPSSGGGSVSGDRIPQSPTSGRPGNPVGYESEKKAPPQQMDDSVASSSSPSLLGTCETSTSATTTTISSATDSQQQQAAVKLRQLLTQGDDDEPSSGMMSSELGDGVDPRAELHNSIESAKSVTKEDNAILKGLLNQEDEDFDDMDTDTHKPSMDDKSMVASSSRSMNPVKEMCGDQEVQKKPSSSSNNNVLLRTLLNEKSDDDEMDKNQVRRPNELLHQLLDMPDECEDSSDDNTDPESILRQLVCNPQRVDIRNFRHQRDVLNERRDHGIKRKNSTSHEADSMGECSLPPKHASMPGVGQGGGYPNRMLLDLLNKEPKYSHPLPASVLTSKLVSQRPQEKLPKDLRGKIIHTPTNTGPPVSAAHILAMHQHIQIQEHQRQQQQQQQQQQVQQQQQQQQPPPQVQPPKPPPQLPPQRMPGVREVISPDGSLVGMQMSGGRVAINMPPTVTSAGMPNSVPPPPPQPNRSSGYLSDLLNKPLRNDGGQMGPMHPNTTGMGGSVCVRLSSPSIVTTTVAGPSAPSLPVSRVTGSMEVPHTSVGDMSGASVRYTSPSNNHPLMVDFVSDTSTPPAPSTSQADSHSDSIISDIVQHVMDLQNEMNMDSSLNMNDGSADPNLVTLLCEMGQTSVSTSSITSQDEKMAINAIQKQLMSCENQNLTPSLSVAQSLPPYSTSQMVSNTGIQSYATHAPPPPVYQGGNTLPSPSVAQAPGSYQQRIRFGGQPPPGIQPQMAMAMQRPGVQYAAVPNVALANLVSGNPQQVRHSLVMQPRRQKQLMQQQAATGAPRRMMSGQQQQLLMQATQGHSPGMPEQLSPTGYDNMADLLNTTVAPNVTVQRSGNIPDSQLSPGYGGSMMGQQAQPQPSQISPGNRMGPSQQSPYSPHSQMASPLGGQPSFPTHTNPMSTYSPQNQQQQQACLSPHPQATMPSYPTQSPHSQLSPRIATPHQQQPPFPSQLSPQSGSGPAAGVAQTQPTWSQASARSNPNLQQQNPMLNAQLSQLLSLQQETEHVSLQQQQQPQPPMPQSQQGAYPNQGRYGQQPPRQQLPPGAPTARSMPSPGTPGAAPHQSPFSDQQQFSTASVLQSGGNPQVTLYQQQQQVRMQRAMSVPGQMPGRVHSPRAPHFANSADPLLSPNPQMSPSFPSSAMSQNYSGPPTSIPQSAPPPSYATSGMGAAHGDQTHFPFDQQSLQVFASAGGSQMDRSRTSLTSEYVRQELRNKVGARTQQQQQGQGQQQQQSQQLLGHAMGGTGAPPTSNLTQSDYDSLALQLDLPSSDGQAKSPGLFTQPLMGLAGGNDNDMVGVGTGGNGRPPHLGPTGNPRIMEESRSERSLLQQLLSE